MSEPYKKTDQIEFWQGQFGNEYTKRNAAETEQLQARTALWSSILHCTTGAPPQSFVEIGANLGLNLRALKNLTSAQMIAVEPNASARERLVADNVVDAENVHDGIAANLPLPDGSADMAFTSGVLIHIHPDELLPSYREIHRVARRYVVSVEYFSDQPTELNYRGNDGFLFKRDFGGYWMENFSDLQLLDYGFAWKPVTGLDNLTWWVFEKRG